MKRCSQKGNKPIPQQNLPVNKEAMFPEGEQAHTQAGLFYGVLQLQTVGSAPALSERTPEGSSELSIVPLRTSTSGSVSEVQYTIKPLLYIFQCIRLRNLRNLHKLKYSNNCIAYNSKNNHINKAASSYHVWNISCHHSVQV